MVRESGRRFFDKDMLNALIWRELHPNGRRLSGSLRIGAEMLPGETWSRPMFFIVRLPRMLFDPRGRADRLEMLIAAAAVVAIEAFLGVAGLGGGVVALMAKALAMWIGVAVSARRLHDLGFSAWWLAAGAGVLCIWSALVSFGFLLFVGAAALSDGSLGILALVGLTLMPAVGAALWLHLAEGEAGENRFGPAAAPVRGSASASQAREA